MSARIFYVLKNDETIGPLSRDEICEKREAGEFAPEDLWASEGMAGWREIKEMTPTPEALKTGWESPVPLNAHLHGITASKKTEHGSERKLQQCPDCGKEVSRRAASCPHCGAPQVNKAEKNQTSPIAFGCAAIAVVFVLFLLSLSIPALFNPARATGNLEEREAHSMAEQFVKNRYPGVSSISSFRESVIEREGNTFRIACTAEGQNSFGGPIRKMVGLELEKNGDKWNLKHIEQR